jgi:hypothetical protein
MQVEQISNVEEWEDLPFCGKRINARYVRRSWADVESGKLTALGCWVKGVPVGFIMFDTNSPLIRIQQKHLYIALICANSVGTPIGSTLMTACYKYALQKKISTIVLHVAGNATSRLATPSERKLKCWYDILGFKSTNQTNRYSQPILLKKITKRDLFDDTVDCKRVKKECREMCERKKKISQKKMSQKKMSQKKMSQKKKHKCAAKTKLGKKCKISAFTGNTKCHIHKT